MSELTDTSNEMIDTNVLVYAHDKDAGIKRERAKQLIRDLSEKDRLVFVTQVLNEFYAAITRPRRTNPLPHEEGLEKLGISLEQLLTNLKILQNGKLTLAGLLLFGKNPERLRPQFAIKATYFAGTDVAVREYIDKQDIHGKLVEHFKEGRAFIKRNLRRIQTTKNFNAPGVLEIPEEAFAETIANAIVHRNYYISAPIQIYLVDFVDDKVKQIFSVVFFRRK
jgi:predicted HTH transcriptional regulator